MSESAAIGNGWTIDNQIELLMSSLRHIHKDTSASPEQKIAALCEEDNLNALMQSSKTNSIEYFQIINKIHEITGLDTQTVSNAIKQKAGEPEEAESLCDSPEVIKKAAETIAKGKSFDYIFEVLQKRHSKDIELGKSLLSSLGSQSVSNSKGIHVISTGTGGYGKSDGIKVMGKLIYPTYFKNGGVTAQNLYYNGRNMPDGVVVGLEDVDWKDELGLSVKRITSDFQEGGTRLSTKDFQGIEAHTAKRISFWASCVDSQADEQLRDRFIFYEVKSDSARCQEIVGYMQSQDECLEKPENYAFETAVCQAITRDLKEHLFHVAIPFATRIKFQGDPRAYGMFSDMIKSSAVWHYAQRKADANGRLIAIVEDFENAKELYEKLGGHDPDKYSEPETNILKAIYAVGPVTQADIRKHTGLSSGRVSDILNGRGEQGHGLLHKCKDLYVIEGRPKQYGLDEGFRLPGKVVIELAQEVRTCADITPYLTRDLT